MTDINADGTIGIVVGAGASGNLLGVFSGPVPAVVNLNGNITGNPRVESAEARSAFRVRVTFDQPMINDSRLTSPSNYAVTPISAGVAVFVTAVSPQPGVTYPEWVDLDVNEMTGGEGYQARVESGPTSPVSQIGLPMTIGGAVASFTGVGENPTVVSVAGIAENLVEITFSEGMLDNAAIRNPSNYVFDGGLSVIAVLEVSGDTVRLVTSDQVPGQLYNLTIG